jgi:biotin transport system permease protein
MNSLYRQGTSLLHRLKVGPKLLILAAIIALLAVFATNPVAILAALAVTTALFKIAFPADGVTTLAKQFWALKWLILIIVIPQLIFGAAWLPVTTNALRLTIAISLATLFTLTTKHEAMLAAIERAVRPLKRIGIKPETVSLIIAMTINAIPMILKFAAQTREAQAARGAKPSIALMTVPLLVASLKYADEFAEALTARGVEV